MAEQKRYRVRFRQEVEEVADVEVMAGSAEDARDMAMIRWREDDDWLDALWRDGDDIDFQGVALVEELGEGEEA